MNLKLNTRIEVSIIRKQNDEAFWLGADVGQTESVSHIPTQITGYKGINVPLTNWEYSFFKGYLLRCTSKKINSVRIYSLHRYTSVKIGSTYAWVYMQNAKAVDYSCCYLILNADKKKIDTDGNVRPDDNKNVYRQITHFNLPSGTYYYREIKANISQMIEEDVPFTVVNSDEVQTIYIDHKPNLYKVYYDSSYTIETPFEDMTPYLNTEFNTCLTNDYYIESNSLSFSYNITPPTFMRFSYDIKSISFINDITNEYNIKWEDGLLTSAHIGSSISLDCGSTRTQISPDSNLVYGQDWQVLGHNTSIYHTKGMDNSKLKVPTYMTVDYGDKSYKQLMPTYLKLTDARYSCDIQWEEFINIRDPWGAKPLGYSFASRHVSGTSYIEYRDMEITKYKNRHYGITIPRYEKSTLKNESEEEDVLWSGTHDDRHSVTGGEIITGEIEMWASSPADKLKSLVDAMSKWYSADIQGYANPSIWYYEDNDGNIEASAYYSGHINNPDNPTISDDAITKSFIGALISRPIVKQGYEDYNF